MAEIITHAHTVRAEKTQAAEADKTIEVTDEWYEKLKAIPFVSSKSQLHYNTL